MTSTPGTNVAVFDPSSSKFPVFFADQEGGDAELLELMEDNLDGGDVNMSDLLRLHVPSGGGRTWELPGGDDDEPAAVASVSGVLVHKQPTRSMWLRAKGAGQEDSPPDCSSDDGEHGLPGGLFGVGSTQHPEGDCETCPMNQWESARPVDGVPQKGKGCKQQLQLWIMQEDAILPTQITLPPTSLRTWRLFTTQLLAMRKSVHGVVTRFALKAEEANGNKYSVVTPTAVRDLAPEERAGAKRFGATIRGRLEAQAAERRAAIAAGEAQVADGPDAGGADVWSSGAVTEALADETPATDAPKGRTKP